MIVFLQDCNQKTTTPGGLNLQEALSIFQLPNGFKIELVAFEPMISDAVAMEIDEDGNIYVVEIYGCPLDTTICENFWKSSLKPGDKIISDIIRTDYSIINT